MSFPFLKLPGGTDAAGPWNTLSRGQYNYPGPHDVAFLQFSAIELRPGCSGGSHRAMESEGPGRWRGR